MHKNILLLVALVLLIAYNACTKKQKDYNLVLDDDGILVEQFDSTNSDENRYTANNTIFKTGTAFHYSFEHIDPKGEQYAFEYIDSIANWRFTRANSINNNAIEQVVITVKEGLQPFIKFFPDYNQTIISYRYITKNGPSKFSGSSGVIENEGNIWMHPPREKYFKILELNPFPYVKAPFKKGNKWNWKLTIGEHWSDPRWKLWKGKIENEYEYTITGKENLQTAFGALECYVIESWAESTIGKTYLTSYFSPDYGFVKMDYTNIDSSKTTLTLTQKVDKQKE